MTEKRTKALMAQVGMPDSVSLKLALEQAHNEGWWEAHQAAVREVVAVLTPDWIAARIREVDGNHDRGAGTIGEYISAMVARRFLSAPAEPPGDVSRGFTPEEAKAHRRFVDEFFPATDKPVPPEEKPTPPAAEVCEWEKREIVTHEIGGGEQYGTVYKTSCGRTIGYLERQDGRPCWCGKPVRIKPLAGEDK